MLLIVWYQKKFKRIEVAEVRSSRDHDQCKFILLSMERPLFPCVGWISHENEYKDSCTSLKSKLTRPTGRISALWTRWASAARLHWCTARDTGLVLVEVYQCTFWITFAVYISCSAKQIRLYQFHSYRHQVPDVPDHYHYTRHRLMCHFWFLRVVKKTIY